LDSLGGLSCMGEILPDEKDLNIITNLFFQGGYSLEDR